VAGLLALPAAAALGGTSVIEGTTYWDVNRDGVRQSGEPALADQEIYLFDGSGAYLRNTKSDAAGNYDFSGLTDGDYEVEYSTSSWRKLRMDWTPTSTGSIHPRSIVNLSGRASVDFGWREIVRSRDLTAPISTFVGPNGLRAESFNDVVSARDVYEAVMAGTVGAEAQFITIRFDYSDSANTALSYQQVNGVYHSYRAVCYNNWISWLTKGDSGVSHEYGHAWSAYHDTIVQQDGRLSGYLHARGLDDDDRIDSSYAWSVRELVAEDYRQLLGSPNARLASALNLEVPPAADVPGLRDYLELVFTAPPTGETVSPPPSADPLPSDPPSAEPSRSAEPSPIPESSPTPGPDTGGAHDPQLEVADPVVNPSPVVQSATISSWLSTAASVTIEIRSAEGHWIKTLVADASVPRGYLEAVWDRRDVHERRVKSGTYVVVVAATGTDGQTVRSQTFFRAR
jgi:hypothetical protein